MKPPVTLMSQQQANTPSKHGWGRCFVECLKAILGSVGDEGS